MIKMVTNFIMKNYLTFIFLLVVLGILSAVLIIFQQDENGNIRRASDDVPQSGYLAKKEISGNSTLCLSADNCNIVEYTISENEYLYVSVGEMPLPEDNSGICFREETNNYFFLTKATPVNEKFPRGVYSLKNKDNCVETGDIGVKVYSANSCVDGLCFFYIKVYNNDNDINLQSVLDRISLDSSNKLNFN